MMLDFSEEGKSMNKLIIIGASGFGREVAWLIERINEKNTTWDLIGFIDDNPELVGTKVNGYTVLGNSSCVNEYKDAYFVCAVGSSKIRKSIVTKVSELNPEIRFATLIDPSVEMSKLVTIGEGTIICAHTIITVNISIGKHVIMNLDCTVGHDAVLHDYVTLYPSVNVSGITDIGECTELGTGMQIIQAKKVGAFSIVGAGAVVVKDIPEKCTAVGSPAKPIKFFE